MGQESVTVEAVAASWRAASSSTRGRQGSEGGAWSPPALAAILQAVSSSKGRSRPAAASMPLRRRRLTAKPLHDVGDARTSGTAPSSSKRPTSCSAGPALGTLDRGGLDQTEDTPGGGDMSRQNRPHVPGKARSANLQAVVAPSCHLGQHRGRAAMLHGSTGNPIRTAKHLYRRSRTLGRTGFRRVAHPVFVEPVRRLLSMTLVFAEIMPSAPFRRSIRKRHWPRSTPSRGERTSAARSPTSVFAAPPPCSRRRKPRGAGRSRWNTRRTRLPREDRLNVASGRHFFRDALPI